MSTTETLRGWPKHIRSITEMPWEYKDTFMGTFDYENDFPYCVYIPENGMWHEPSALLCMLQDNYILFQGGAGKKPVVYPLKDIYRMEHGQILLNSWIEIGGMADGRPSVHRLTFNTVREELFRPFFKRFRRLHTPEKEEKQIGCEDKFSFLMKISYKFLNYGRRALLEGEEASHVVHQPGIRVRPIKRLPFNKAISTNTLFVCTDTELILLREQSVKMATSKYGVITDYIPLSTIRKAWTQQSRYEGTAEWTVELKNGEQLKTYVQDENRAKIASILTGSHYDINNISVYGAYH